MNPSIDIGAAAPPAAQAAVRGAAARNTAGAAGKATPATDPSGDALAALFAAFVDQMLPLGTNQAAGAQRQGHAAKAHRGRHKQADAEKPDASEAATAGPAFLGLPAAAASELPTPAPAPAPASEQAQTQAAAADGSAVLPGAGSVGAASSEQSIDPLGQAEGTASTAVPRQSAASGQQAAQLQDLLETSTVPEAAAPQSPAQAIGPAPAVAPGDAATATGQPGQADDVREPKDARTQRRGAPGVTAAGRALARSLAAMWGSATTAGAAAGAGGPNQPQTETPADGPSPFAQLQQTATDGVQNAAGTPAPVDTQTEGIDPGNASPASPEAALAQAMKAAAAGTAAPDAADSESGERAAGPVVGQAAPDAGSRGTLTVTALPPAAAAIEGVSSSQDPAVGLAQSTLQADSAQDGDVASQMVRAMRIQIRDGIGTARVQLRPEHLGEVQIDVTVTRDRVSAVVHAERADVRAQIEQQGAALRTGLSAVGLHLDELTVREEAPRRDQADRRQPQDPQGKRRRSAPSDKAFVLVA